MTTDLMLGRDVQPEEIGQLTPLALSKELRITFQTSELQSLCPAVVGIQPDIYNLTISFFGNVSIESKSLKLWLMTFRDKRIFAEELVVEIATKIKTVTAFNSEFYINNLEVTLVQNIRGGIVETVSYFTP